LGARPTFPMFEPYLDTIGRLYSGLKTWETAAGQLGGRNTIFPPEKHSPPPYPGPPPGTSSRSGRWVGFGRWQMANGEKKPLSESYSQFKLQIWSPACCQKMPGVPPCLICPGNNIRLPRGCFFFNQGLPAVTSWPFTRKPNRSRKGFCWLPVGFTLGGGGGVKRCTRWGSYCYVYRTFLSEPFKLFNNLCYSPGVAEKT